MSGPAFYRHKPTVVQALQFTPGNRASLREWLTAELGPGRFDMTNSHLAISTTQGDSRDVLIGGWVIKRRTHAGGRYEFYPVEAEVMRDYVRVEPAGRRRLFRGRAS